MTVTTFKKLSRPLSRRSLLGNALAAPLLALPVGMLVSRNASAALSDDDRADVARIEQYIDGISTLEAKFQQFDPQGGLSFGRIYLRRPGRLRVEYDPPVPIVVVADGTLISYYDSELDQLSQLPLRQSAAWFLLRSPMNLAEDVTVTEVDRRPGALRIKMYQTDEPDAGQVEMIFQDNPIELKQWTVVDAQNREVRVGLFDLRLGGELPPDLFAAPAKRRERSGGNR